MRFKLAIADTIEFKVKLTANVPGSPEKQFRFDLIADRVSEDSIQAHVEQAQAQGLSAREIESSMNDFLRTHIKGWRGQALVLDEEGKPADFGPEAFDAMLGIAGVTGIIFSGFAVANRAKGKPGN